MTARLDPEVAREVMVAAGLEPLESYPGSQKAWLCRCLVCGKSVSPRLNAIRSGQGSCKWCSKRIVDGDGAEAIMRQSGLITLGPYPGALVP